VSDKVTEQKIGELMVVMARLRGENGCPWDKEQTHLSLKPCLLEETYELLDALDDGDPKKLRDELGDVLLQVVFHSQIAMAASRSKTLSASSRKKSSAAIPMSSPASRCRRTPQRF
jgi:uncharacterized protein YabN with tetrapyrrole methylase and pyrophosphatase domain